MNIVRDELATKVRRQRELLDQAQREGQVELTGKRASEYDRLDAELVALEHELREVELEFREKDLATPQSDGIRPTPYGNTRFLDENEENHVPLLGPEDRMETYVRDKGLVRSEERDLSFGKWIRGLVTGNWKDAEAEQRALSEGSLGGGGYTVPLPLSAAIIDKARNQARVLQAGARTVPMDSQTLKMARVAGDPTAAWKSENAAVTESDMIFEVVTFTAQTLIALVRASRELIEDSNNVDDALRNAFSEAFSLELDRAALRGSGTAPEPRGVRNQSGVTVTSLGANGATPTYDNLVDSVIGPIEDNNFSPNAIIWHPRTGRTFAKKIDTTNQPMRAPQMVEDVRKLATAQIPVNITQGTSTDTSEIYGGQWNQLMIGIRHNLEINVLRERYSDNFQFGFLAHLRADIQVAQPKAFAVLTGVRP